MAVLIFAGVTFSTWRVRTLNTPLHLAVRGILALAWPYLIYRAWWGRTEGEEEVGV